MEETNETKQTQVPTTPEERSEQLLREWSAVAHRDGLNSIQQQMAREIAAAIRQAVEFAEAQRDDYARTIDKINNKLWGLLYPDAPESWEYVTQPLVHIGVELRQLNERISTAVTAEREAFLTISRGVLVDHAWHPEETNPDLFVSLADTIEQKVRARSTAAQDTPLETIQREASEAVTLDVSGYAPEVPAGQEGA